jgi:hypothetical protein
MPKIVRKKSGAKQELDKIFKTYGMTAAGALREIKRRKKIRKTHEKKRGH